MTNFNQLSTVKFQQKMRSAAIEIYKLIFPNCRVEDLRENGLRVHILDQEFGIDSLIRFSSGQWISVQEKYRDHSALKWLDFTQEYINGEGTPYEGPGEWFKLGAQIYFYGWANKSQTAFEKWILLDIPKYKLLVEKAGGLDSIGERRQNKIHGASSFFCIPIRRLEPAALVSFGIFSDGWTRHASLN